ncbi:MAG: glycosyltransferase family 2 protein [Gammaproteobacteria bacterium]|nr:glycosyltransferase family 2 protein [Gammaproteobacteria bacterium]
MKKLLTIAIPTFNRAELLDQQLQRLHKELSGLEEYCNILVSNNQSTDETAAVIEKWQAQLPNFSLFTQENNIGAVRNIAWCLQNADTPFVWALSDDDPLIEGSLRGIIKRLQDNPDLAVMVLNYASFNSKDGSHQSEQRFELTEDESDANGKNLFASRLSRGALGALVFTSALIYRSDYARKAIESWPDGHVNLLYQLYITASCATRGRFLITHENCIEYMDGRSFFLKDKQLQVQMKLIDVPQIYARLIRIGYPRTLCMQLFLNHMKGKHFNGMRMWLQIGKNALKHPLRSLKGLGVLAQSFAVIWRADRSGPQGVVH